MKWLEAQIPHPQSPSWSETRSQQARQQAAALVAPASVPQKRPTWAGKKSAPSSANQSEAACSPAAFPNTSSKGN